MVRNFVDPSNLVIASVSRPALALYIVQYPKQCVKSGLGLLLTSSDGPSSNVCFSRQKQMFIFKCVLSSTKTHFFLQICTVASSNVCFALKKTHFYLQMFAFLLQKPICILKCLFIFGKNIFSQILAHGVEQLLVKIARLCRKIACNDVA